MKKLLCIMLMLFTCLTPVYADETQVTLTYTVPESYTVSIPASVAVNDTANFNVSISNAVLEPGKQLVVSANSSNYSSGWRMKNGSAYQSYTLKNGSDDVVPDETIISLPAGDPTASATATLTAAMQGIPTITGTYTDSVAFTAKVSYPPYLTFSSSDSFTVAFSAKKWDGAVEYSTDAVNWTVYDAANTEIESVNNKVYFRGIGNTRFATSNKHISSFILTGNDIACTGNIENLLDYQTVAAGEHPTMENYTFAFLFYNCTSLTTAPELPSTTLANYCYNYMFQGCTGLTSAPALPATTLATTCYKSMFYGCTNLTVAPALPATTLAKSCYNYMFQGCTSLTSVPALPATTLAENCYYGMFKDCTKIKLSTTQTDSYTIPYRVPNSDTGSIMENSLKDMFSNTGGTFTGTPEINTTYYLDSSNSIVE